MQTFVHTPRFIESRVQYERDTILREEDLMRERSLIIRHLALAGLLCMTFSACTVTETVKDIFGTTSDILSSTTPSDWFTADGVLKQTER